MNKYSLRFQDPQLEAQYLLSWSKRQLLIFKIGSLLITAAIIGYNVLAVEMGYSHMVFVFYAIIEIFMIIAYIIVTRYHRAYASKCLCLYNIVIASYGSMALVYIGEEQQNHYPLAILLITFNFIFCQSPDFLDGSISFFLGYSMHSFASLTLKSRLGFLIPPISIVCIIIFYQTVKTQRLLFLAQQKDCVWQKIREKYLTDGMIVINFDEDTQTCSLGQFNDSAEINFNISDNMSLKEFMRTYSLVYDSKTNFQSIIQMMFSDGRSQVASMLMKEKERIQADIFQCRLETCTFIVVLKKLVNAEIVMEKKEAQILEDKMFLSFVRGQIQVMKDIGMKKYQQKDLALENIKLLSSMLLLSEISIKPKLQKFSLSCVMMGLPEIEVQSDLFLLRHLFKVMGDCRIVSQEQDRIYFERVEEERKLGLVYVAVVKRILDVVGPYNNMDGCKFSIYSDLLLLF